MPNVANVGSIFFGICRSHSSPITVSGQIVSGSTSVLTEGMPTARIGDTVIASCGHSGNIITGSSVHLVDGMPCAFVGSLVKSDSLDGQIIKGSSTVISG